MVTFLPLQSTSNTQGWKSHQLYQASHMWLLCYSHQEASLSQGLQSTSEILAAVLSYSCFIICIFQAAPIPCDLFCPCDPLHGLKTVCGEQRMMSWKRERLIFQSLEPFPSPILQTPPQQNVRAGIHPSAVPSHYYTESIGKK